MMESDPSARKQAVTVGYFLLAGIALLALQWLLATYNSIETIPYSEFERLVAQGSVAEVTVAQDMIQGKLKDKLPSGRSASSPPASIRRWRRSWRARASS